MEHARTGITDWHSQCLRKHVNVIVHVCVGQAVQKRVDH
jgi:hypothetical protein